MSFLWDSIKDKAKQVGTAAGVASQKTKLRTEVLLVDRGIHSRQQAFGVQLYDHCQPLSKKPEFFASDDQLTATLRPFLIEAQREIQALELKRQKVKEQLNQASIARQAAFAQAATNWQEKLANAGKSTAFAGSEAKLKTEVALIEAEMKHYKQEFGVKTYGKFEEMEDATGWLPTDRDIRAFYDSCRQDIEKMKKKKTTKEEEIGHLDGTSPDDGVPTVRASPSSSYAAPPPPHQQQKPTAVAWSDINRQHHASNGQSNGGFSQSANQSGAGLFAGISTTTTPHQPTQPAAATSQTMPDPFASSSAQPAAYTAPSSTAASSHAIPDPFASSQPSAYSNNDSSQLFGGTAAPQQSVGFPASTPESRQLFGGMSSSSQPSSTTTTSAMMSQTMMMTTTTPASAAPPQQQSFGYNSAPTPTSQSSGLFGGTSVSNQQTDPFASLQNGSYGPPPMIAPPPAGQHQKPKDDLLIDF